VILFSKVFEFITIHKKYW